MDIVRKPALSNSPVLVCNGNREISGYIFYNPNDEVTFVHFYDQLGDITVGTTAPWFTVGLPPASAGHISFDGNIRMENKKLRMAATEESDGAGTVPDSAVLMNVILE